MTTLRLYHHLILSMLLGVFVGVFFPSLATFLAPVGELFIRLLRMMIVPLVFTSLVTAILGLGNFESLGRLGIKTMLYCLFTTACAAFFGLIVGGFLINTSFGLDSFSTFLSPVIDTQIDVSFWDVIFSIIPDNLFNAFLSNNMLSVIFLAFLCGLSLLAVKSNVSKLISFFENCDDIFLMIMSWIIAISPIGVFSLIASLIASLGINTLKPLMMYVLIIFAGSLLFAFFLLVFFFLLKRQSPMVLLKNAFPALATAFSTSSSIATLPVTLDCLNKHDVPRNVSGFVAPLGATLNMDGTALYHVVSTLFLASVFQVDLTAFSYLLIGFTAILASVATAAIPSGGVVTLLIVLTVVQIPLEGIALLLVVDRLTDMCRTTVNVFSDICTAAILSK